MTSLRIAAFLVSLALHGAVALALLETGEGDALDGGAGADLLRVELGLAAQGLHDSGSDIESVDGTEMPAAAESVAQEKIEEVSAIEELREPPPEEIEPAEVAEAMDEVIASAQGPEAEIAPQPLPDIALEKTAGKAGSLHRATGVRTGTPRGVARTARRSGSRKPRIFPGAEPSSRTAEG